MVNKINSDCTYLELPTQEEKGTCLPSNYDEYFMKYLEMKFNEKGTYLTTDEVMATDEDGVKTIFEDINHASRSLGISTENITKCCKNIRGYEYITVEDKKYRFKYLEIIRFTLSHI